MLIFSDWRGTRTEIAQARINISHKLPHGEKTTTKEKANTKIVVLNAIKFWYWAQQYNHYAPMQQPAAIAQLAFAPGNTDFIAWLSFRSNPKQLQNFAISLLASRCNLRSRLELTSKLEFLKEISYCPELRYLSTSLPKQKESIAHVAHTALLMWRWHKISIIPLAAV